jgi:FkbM family methyltransferase
VQKSGAWEPEKLNRLCDTFKKYHKVGTQAHFLDVGANIGSISVPMARCLDKIGDVISVEAMPHIADHVMAAVEANKLQNARLFNYALTSSFGAQDGELKMSLDTKNKGGTNVVGNKHNEAEIAQLGYKILTVPITTLDSILAQDASLQKVLVMKIDIEGSEGRALHGAHKLLTSYPPCFISIELIPEWTIRASTPKDEILSLLRYAGYDAPMKTSEVGDYFLQQVDLEACIARVMGT